MKVKYVKITAGMLTGLAVASTAPYGVGRQPVLQQELRAIQIM